MSSHGFASLIKERDRLSIIWTSWKKREKRVNERIRRNEREEEGLPLSFLSLPLCPSFAATPRLG